MRFGDEKPDWLYVGLAGADVHERPEARSLVIDRLRPESLVARANRADREARGWISVRGEGGRLGAVAPDANVHPLLDHGFGAVTEGRRERPDGELAPGRSFSSVGALRGARVLVGHGVWWLIRDHDGSIGWAPDEAVLLRSTEGADADPEARSDQDYRLRRRHRLFLGGALVVVTGTTFAVADSSGQIPFIRIGIAAALALPVIVAIVRRRALARARRRSRPW